MGTLTAYQTHLIFHAGEEAMFGERDASTLRRWALPAVRLGLAIVVRSKMPQKKRDDDVVMEEVRPARLFSTLQPTTS